MYVPLDSHDTERFKTLVGGNTDKLKLAFLFQMAFLGAPAIYYGDEIGQEGGKDPDSHRAFPWKEMDWNQDLRSWIKILIAIRKRSPSLRRGGFVQLFAEDGLYAFARTLGEEKILIALNATGRSRRYNLSCASLGWTEERNVQNLISHEIKTVAGSQITFTLPAWSGAWIG